jgi:HlyD family secretion protein
VNINPEKPNNGDFFYRLMKNRPMWTSTDFIRRQIKDRPIQIVAGLLFILIIWFVVSAVLIRDDNKSGSQSFFEVRRGPLMISVTESGTTNNREKVVIKSKVEGQTRILSLVPEGTQVRKGDLLIKLDSSNLEDEKMKQQITVLNAEAAYINARENLVVAKNLVESDIAKAKLEYRFSRVDLKKYLEGEYPQELQQAEAEITIAREELQREEDKLEWSQRLYRDGYITRSELQADELASKRKKLNVELAESKLELLQKYTHMRKLQELKSNLEQTKMALDRVKRKAVADTIQAEAALKAKESEFKRVQVKLQKIDDQIAKCIITAPVEGMIVYATTGKSQKYTKGPMEEGLEVQEGQELIHMPTTSSMMAEVNIRESSLIKVRQGMPARIAVDALPERVFSGRVGKIDLLPDSTMAWLNPDVKVYRSEIYLDGDASALRPGMTCRVEIIVEEYSDTLYIPVQSVVRVNGKPVVYVAGSNEPERREVEIGMDNDRVIRIVKGLSEGEKVLLAPPLGPSEAPLQEKLPPETERKTESSETTSTKDSAPEQKPSVPQKEKKGPVKEMSSDVREIPEANTVKLPSLIPPLPSEPVKIRLNSQKERAYYLVQKGDTLSKISGKENVYADPIKWPSLFRHNIDKLGQIEEVEDFEQSELPEGLELKFLTPDEVSENLKKLGQKRWALNVTSEKNPQRIVLPAITLIKKGYHAYLVRTRIKGEEWMRLRVGFFKKRSEAVSEKKKLWKL